MSLNNCQATMGYQAEASPIISCGHTQTANPVTQCVGCGKFVIPLEKHTIGGCAVVSALGLCCVMPLLGLIPLCCSPFKDVIRVCPHCRTRLLHYKPSSSCL